MSNVMADIAFVAKSYVQLCTGKMAQITNTVKHATSQLVDSPLQLSGCNSADAAQSCISE